MKLRDTANKFLEAVNRVEFVHLNWLCALFILYKTILNHTSACSHGRLKLVSVKL